MNEPYMLLLRVLFETGYALNDSFTTLNFGGAGRVVLSSASSKTAFATAFCIRRFNSHIEVVGLTSAEHVPFCQSLGSRVWGGTQEPMYTSVLAYDDLESLEVSGQGRLPTLYCDMAGDAALTHAVHTHLGADLVHSCAVGRTHVTADGGGADALPGPCDPAGLAQLGLRRF